MKLSKRAFKEIFEKCKKRFPKKIGDSLNSTAWCKFCEKKPIEFLGEINGAQYVMRVSNDAYAVCFLNPSGSFKIYSF